jgi:hypothetical protein
MTHTFFSASPWLLPDLVAAWRPQTAKVACLPVHAYLETIKLQKSFHPYFTIIGLMMVFTGIISPWQKPSLVPALDIPPEFA